MAPNLKHINLNGFESITKLPNLCAPNLENLDLSYCKNLVECHESIGFLDKLQILRLSSCKKLQNLPSHLTWKSLYTLDISSCSSLDFLFFKEWRLTWTNLAIRFHGLYTYCYKNVVDLEDIIYKVPTPKILCIYTGKSRPWCEYYTVLKSYTFLDLSNVQDLDLSNVGNLIELDFLMKSYYFLVLERLYLNEINIITILESIIKFTRLETLAIKCCKYLREILRLPRSTRRVHILNSHSLHPQSLDRLFSLVFDYSGLEDLNLFDRNRVKVEFACDSYRGISHILRSGIHAKCICPFVRDLSTDTLPPTSIPAFPICSISNTVTPSPHLLNSCLELSHSNSMETTYNDFDSPLEGSHDDGCDLSLSLCTSPMGGNYPPP
ncbi:disease resistance protein rpp5 [Quercus suber]|uniref:Disease resistance protein rpp5 n=1 Tax=Quercus suber TaxID=58331 RepID=A0AAW0IY04_QUESU